MSASRRVEFAAHVTQIMGGMQTAFALDLAWPWDLTGSANYSSSPAELPPVPEGIITGQYVQCCTVL